MKSTIWSRFFFFVVIPFLLLYTVQAAFIIQTSIRDKTEKVKLDVKHAARFGEVSLQNALDGAKLALISAAGELQNIDTARPDARILGDQVLISGFRNSAVINSWLIFEPNAFDGRDEDHRGEEPGDGSGRYRRFYTRQGDVQTPNLHEAPVDALMDDASRRYRVPSAILLGTSREPFIDDAYGRDYGEGRFAGISLSAPMFRDGEFIGCVGQDILLTEEIPDLVPGIVSALFTPAGILRRYEDPGKMGMSLDELGFPDSGRIREALNRGESLFLSGDYSPLPGTDVFACFYPVKLDGFDTYLYTAVPTSSVGDTLLPLMLPFLYALVLFLVIFAVFLYYLFRAVSKPVRELNLACDAISRGNFDAEIVRPRSRNEMGIMIGTLYRMVEQFRIHITMRERSQKLLDMYTRLHKALYRHGRMEEVFDEMMPVIGDFFAVRRASLVLVAGETARIFASFEPGKDVQRTDEQFLYHQQAAALLAGRKYLSLNTDALKNQKVDFAGSQALYLCLLPFLVSNELRGYIIMEGDGGAGPLIHHDAALLFLSETISFMLTQRETVPVNLAQVSRDSDPDPRTEGPDDAAPDEGDPVIKAARAIKDLDVDKGLFHAGGAEEQYGALLRISARSFTAKMQTMRSLFTADLPAFGIEIHGIKGALNAIGAGGLGEQARELEFAAKAGDAGYCAGTYPVFEGKLAAFTMQLEAAAGKRIIPSRGPGSVPVLIGALEKALEASRLFDSTAAAAGISPLLGYTWEDAEGASLLRTGETLEKISDALDSMDYDAAERDMILLLEYLKAEHSASGK
jgi:HAMP domain-containing protein